MRQAAVLDVGCHSALLAVGRRRVGSVLEQVYSRKVRLRLHEALDGDGCLDESGVESVWRAVAEVVAQDLPVPPREMFAFATSVIRDAPNREEVIARVNHATGTRLRVLPGVEEARLAYVAARQWAGFPQHPLLVLDIGGGTVEVAAGTADRPHAAHSLPLGARRITRDHLPGGRSPDERQLARTRDYVRQSLTEAALPTAAPGDRVLACSKVFAQLARLTAHLGEPQGNGRWLTLSRLRTAIPLLAGMTPAHRARLPGISRHRAEQSLAGALVAEALLETCGAPRVEICGWSTREGLLLEHLQAPGGREAAPGEAAIA
ncbi:hypothetical protein [Streptomyces sp. MP131-18]|uniref:Ppx/GppA phosphatase family protein n=1 Tax=Streptomyces sp. MP131-18 TaxID=1857892 RepID=UPI00097BC008|nr:hypothetical protein [Streptomyces sp. MP131-18]ONK11701.1 Guanosine-5'-triphosphate,3'-diphosphate pyrophosphatase [Streptomyces sp. MP131-18]